MCVLVSPCVCASDGQAGPSTSYAHSTNSSHVDISTSLSSADWNNEWAILTDSSKWPNLTENTYAYYLKIFLWIPIAILQFTELVSAPQAKIGQCYHLTGSLMSRRWEHWMAKGIVINWAWLASASLAIKLVLKLDVSFPSWTCCKVETLKLHTLLSWIKYK